MCGHKGYGTGAVLVGNRVQILIILGWNWVGHSTARFAEYPLERPKSPEIFGFYCSESSRFLWRNITWDFCNKGTDIPIAKAREALLDSVGQGDYNLTHPVLFAPFRQLEILVKPPYSPSPPPPPPHSPCSPEIATFRSDYGYKIEYKYDSVWISNQWRFQSSHSFVFFTSREGSSRNKFGMWRDNVKPANCNWKLVLVLKSIK